MSIAVGSFVKVNGYRGTIVEICTGQLRGMVVVQLASGQTCVSISELEVTP